MLTPLDGRVVLKGVPVEEVTQSGIILTNKKEEKPKVFEVVALSEGKRLDDGSLKPHVLQVGQKVICSSYAGDDITLEDQDFKVIAEDSILAIVKN